MQNKVLTDERLLHEARKAGVEEIYLEHLAEMKFKLDTVIKNGQGDLAGFLFAFASLGNEITRRKRDNFKPH